MSHVAPAFLDEPFRIEFDASEERLTIPIRRRWSTVTWVALATAFTVAMHLRQLSEHDRFQIFVDASIIVFTIFGFIFGLLASLLAIEFIQIGNGKLYHGWRLLGLGKTNSYDVSEIRALGLPIENYSSPRDKVDGLVSLRRDFGKRGAVKFDTETKSIYLGITLHEADAVGVLDWLTRRLPKTASEL